MEHTVVNLDAEDPKHAQLVTCLVRMQAIHELGYFQLSGILCTDPCNMEPCIIMLQHKVMVVNE